MSEQWSEWIEWAGGECPIPWADGYEFRLRTKAQPDGFTSGGSALMWGTAWNAKVNRITGYRYRIDRAPAGFVHPSPLAAERAQRLSDEKAKEAKFARYRRRVEEAKAVGDAEIEAACLGRPAPAPAPDLSYFNPPPIAASRKCPGIDIVAPITRLGGWL